MPPTKTANKIDWEDCPIGFHVLEEMKRCGDNLSKINENITDIKVELGKLKVKSGMWGALGACIPILTGFLIYAITTLL